MSEWVKQKRPKWCPHQDCQFKLMKQNKACVGVLPEPELHNGVPNDSRLCIQDSPVFDLQINEGDVFHLRTLLDTLYPSDEEWKPETKSPYDCG